MELKLLKQERGNKYQSLKDRACYSIVTVFILIGVLACNENKSKHHSFKCKFENGSKICTKKSNTAFSMMFDEENNLMECSLREQGPIKSVLWNINPRNNKIISVQVNTESGYVFDFFYSLNGRLEHKRCLDLKNQMMYEMIYLGNKKELSCSFLIPDMQVFIKTYYVELNSKNDTLDNYFMYSYNNHSFKLKYHFKDLDSKNLGSAQINYTETPEMDFNLIKGNDDHYYPKLKTNKSSNCSVAIKEGNSPIIGYLAFPSGHSPLPKYIGHVIFNGSLHEKWKYFTNESLKYQTKFSEEGLRYLLLESGFEKKNGKLVPSDELMESLKI